MQLERICRVAVDDFRLQIGGQVDNRNGRERTLLGTDTAPNAETLGYESEFRLWSDLDAPE
jgi:hypothetical protein